MGEQQNFIVFLTDQQRWDTAGSYGNPLGLTPNFDKMASEGTYFQNAFTPNPLCGPARASIQMGKYPSTIGCFRNGIPLPEGDPTIAGYLKEIGYTTAYVGKWHLATTEPVVKEQRGGYDYWMAANRLEWTSEPYNTVVFDNDNTECFLPGYRTDAIIDAGIKFVHSVVNRDKDPWFLFLSLLEPHHQNKVDNYISPHTGAKRKFSWYPGDLLQLVGSSRIQIDGYLRTIERIDNGLGRLMDAVESLGVKENTNIVYASDHGCHFRTRNSEYKRSPHESSIRIPMAGVGPYFNGRGVVPNLVTLIDIPTMILDAAEYEGVLSMEGGKLGNGVHQNYVKRDDRDDEEESVLIEITEKKIGRAIRTRRWKYGVVQSSSNKSRNGKVQQFSERVLYDLESDPNELNNVIGVREYNDVKEKLAYLLRQKIRKTGVQEPYIDRNVGL